ncbi:hypothetical protein M2459_001848 [Parabacteroides sp. PF5-5]|uniref:DUF3784 domain-containing protein n=1 Tax=unclassified Parabacteroides TaxID=2649774 RepID=UPI0024750761|nr:MULTISPECIES: DUF3784 domain-containing protein [unclassified Parabacteroides]MDH6305395.1 hypothetical protein [Parabacteroides sp. PH5-39]MDH6316105.1 hypothetical protein [Parabacteroides sp. PF5-13]MDH6320255.1 hypothetical protein [Parabacteroides sp. PH5-13]MDH6323985.1 hypothetical protein [Parabacteroides sp. PH5-8]MDH6327296.1 hypothetical protein [Parabacteroides sp. PH5-41]
MATYIAGLFLIVLGFLVVRFPMLLSGYNTMPKEEREKVDIAGLSRMVRSVFIGMGLCLILGTFILSKTGDISLMDILSPIVIFGGVGITVVARQRYTKALTISRFSRYKNLLVFAFLIGFMIYIVYSGMSDKVVVYEDRVQITGSYGVNIPFENITQMEYRETMPDITLRTNGFSLWKYRKGYFRTDELGKVMLFLHSYEGPYLIIHSTTNDPVIINRSKPEDLERLYAEINTKLES